MVALDHRSGKRGHGHQAARRTGTGQEGPAAAGDRCRGREYLRITYRPTYTEAPNLDRLRQRGLAPRRALALREFMLGHEALHRFVEREPLYRVHECVFGVLALESEPVDPRLRGEASGTPRRFRFP